MVGSLAVGLPFFYCSAEQEFFQCTEKNFPLHCSKIFTPLYISFVTKPSNTFYKAFQKVLEGFVTNFTRRCGVELYSKRFSVQPFNPQIYISGLNG